MSVETWIKILSQVNKTRPWVLYQWFKGNLPPGSCPHHKQLTKPSPWAPKPKVLLGNGSVSVMISKKKHSQADILMRAGNIKSVKIQDYVQSNSSPQQLLVTVSIGTQATVHMGTSSTLIHGGGGIKGVKSRPPAMGRGLASYSNWMRNFTVNLQGKVSTLPVALSGWKL